jgi:GDP-4-dehydro-6-deoxy-D-mannose reductase
MRILVTGATGFVGSHLMEALLGRGGVEVCGFARQAEFPPGWSHLADRAAMVHGDLIDPSAILTLLRDRRPEQIYHLAGYADAGQSFQEPDAAWAGNLTATRCLYDAIRQWGGKPRILFISTGAVYGEPVDPEQLLDENSVLRPNSPYAVSKAAADLLSYQYVRAYGLDIVRARPFNHVGPGQSPRFALAHFAWQIAKIERGQAEPVLRVGNLWTERDYTDVRDIVQAYLRLMENGSAGETYNIGSGETRTMLSFLDQLLAVSRVRIAVETDPHLTRKVETAKVRVNAELLRRTTGWSPRISVERTLTDMLEYCRKVIGH